MPDRTEELRRRAIERSRKRRAEKGQTLQQTCRHCQRRFVGVGTVCGNCEGQGPQGRAA